MALLIHFIPLCYFFIKNTPSQNLSKKLSNVAQVSESISLSSFHAPIKRAHQVSDQTRHSNKSTKPLEYSQQSILAKNGVDGQMAAGPSQQNLELGYGNSEASETTFLKFNHPTYPPIARDKGYEGVVKILVFYNLQGIVENVEITQSSGYKILDEVVRKSAYEWRLSTKTAGNFEKSFEFKLKN
jgi:TonB family protein